jgi:hypothetical protein
MCRFWHICIQSFLSAEIFGFRRSILVSKNADIHVLFNKKKLVFATIFNSRFESHRNSSNNQVYHVLSGGLPNSALRSQSRQSAKLFLQSSALGLPHSLTRRRVCKPPPPPLGHTRLRERGWGSPNSDRGDRHCGTLVYLCFVITVEA